MKRLFLHAGWLSRVLAFLALLLAAATVSASAAEPRESDLPKVVLIGDSIRMSYAATVAKALDGKARIISSAANGGDSSNVLAHLEEWAIREQPAIVHFNCGIHDTKKFISTGAFQTPPDKYEANLRRIVERIRQETKAVVLFSTTTPILNERAAKARQGFGYELLGDSVAQYNQIAVRVMQELNTPVNDLHALLAKPDPPETTQTLIVADGVHLAPKGVELAGQSVAAFIARHLPEPDDKPGAATDGAQAQPPSRPNLVLIVSDDQGYRDLGCYGSEEAKTPHLDALAAEGARLTSFYVSWPACTPSRASLLTGRYPQRNGLYDMIRNDMVNYGHRYTPAEYAFSPEMILGADERELFLSQLLQSGGYTCGCFGKWDSGQLRRFLPLQRGFDDFYGFANTGIDYFTHERYGVPSMRRGNALTTEDQGTYATELFEREALRFVRENRDRPFFLYLPFNAPHGSSSLEPDVRGTVQAPASYLARFPAGSTKAEQRRQGYLAAVACMDDAIGRLLHLLDELKLADNTLIVFLSDNGGGGGADNRPLRGGKAQMFEGGLRVPCLARWPGRIPAGAVCDEFLTALEWFPTLASAAGVEPPAGVTLDGFDLLPVLQGEQQSPREEMFWKRRDDRAARVGHWKWVESARGGGLFDLSRDIGEESDLSQERPEMLKRLQDRYAAWEQAMAAAEPRGPFRDY